MCNINQNRFIGMPNPYWNGGCIRPQPQPWRGGQQHHRNLEDQNVGSPWRLRNPFCNPNQGNGYAIDLNNNGRYDRGRDGVLVFDQNRDGKYDQRDVSSTNDMMKAARGNYDFNGDGRVDCRERQQGFFYRQRYSQLDRNRDGRLDTNEIAQGGGRVWVDKSRGGGISSDELHSPYNIPNNNWFGGGSRRLDSVDPIWGSTTSSNRPWWNQPCGGGIRPPFGGGIYPCGGRVGY